MNIAKFYYLIKPFLPRSVQIALRRRVVMTKRSWYKKAWPIDERAGAPPANWSGWPENKKFALVLTHDVDTEKGQSRCDDLIELEERLGFRSSFNFVPEGYKVSPALREHLQIHGFEVGVHGLRHENIFVSRMDFDNKAVQINRYLKQWDSAGFRAPCMYHNLEWIADFDIEYDASTFDTDPFEPQSDGVGTIFPFWVSKATEAKGYVELPYTLAQDFTLFVLMREKTIDIWKSKLDWVVRHGGMVLLNTHPDYMRFNGERTGVDEYPARYYEDLLNYIRETYEGQYWHALPRDVARYFARQYAHKESGESTVCSAGGTFE